jgi:hypothetical protein
MRFRIDIENIEKARKHLSLRRKMPVTPISYRSEIGQPIIFDFILDISEPMRDFCTELIDGFNDIMITALKNASNRHKGGIRIGCLLFSDKIIPAWQGFKTLEELGPRPLKRAMFDQDGLHGKTALHSAMKSGILWTAAAMRHIHEKGRGEVSKGRIIVLTDGVNNMPPMDESAVANTFDSIGKIERRNLQAKIMLFNTAVGLTSDQFDKMCELTGFTSAGFIEIPKNAGPAERRASFRQQIRNLFR